MGLFGSSGKKAAPAPLDTRQAARDINKEQRGMDREIQKLQRDETQMIAQIKQAARKGSEHEARLLTKQLLQIRKAKEKMLISKVQMGSCKTQITSMGAQQKMANTMKTTTGIMSRMNQQLDVKDIQKTAMNMQKAQMEGEMAQETLDEAFDQMDGDEIEEEMDAEIAGVMDELAIESLGGMKTASKGGLSAQKAAPTKVSDQDVDNLIAQMMAPPQGS